MFVKTHKDQYVNTDHIEVIKPDRDTGQWKVYFTSRNIGTLPEEAALYLLSVIEADNGFVPGAEIEKIKVPLTTRIAQALRYEFANGATINQLEEFLDLPLPLACVPGKPDLLEESFMILIDEGIIKRYGPLFYHAEHFTASPDPLTEAATPTDTSEEYSERIISPKSDG